MKNTGSLIRGGGNRRHHNAPLEPRSWIVNPKGYEEGVVEYKN